MLTYLKTKGSQAYAALVVALQRRVVWVRGERQDWLGEPTDRFALLAILGVEHVAESQKRYPVVNRLELLRILALESQQSGTTVLSRIGPLEGESRLVTRYTLKEFPTNLAPSALFAVPETWLLSLSISSGEGMEVSRDGRKFYVTTNGRSHPQGALIRDFQSFLAAAGLPAPTTRVVVEDLESIRARLIAGVRRLSWADWPRLIRKDALEPVSQSLRPVSIGVSAIIIGYLLLTSAYLLGMNALRDWQLARLGAEVQPLFQAEQTIERLGQESRALTELLNARQSSWSMWEIIPTVWQNESGLITGASYQNRSLKVQGRAKSAVTVLEEIAASPLVVSADFQSGVRQRNEREQEFTLAIEMAPASVLRTAKKEPPLDSPSSEPKVADPNSTRLNASGLSSSASKSPDGDAS